MRPQIELRKTLSRKRSSDWELRRNGEIVAHISQVERTYTYRLHNWPYFTSVAFDADVTDGAIAFQLIALILADESLAHG